MANFIGSTNQLNGQVSKTDADGTGTVRTDAGEISGGLPAGLDQEPMSSWWCALKALSYTRNPRKLKTFLK